MSSLRVCHNHPDQPATKLVIVTHHPEYRGKVEVYKCPLCNDMFATWENYRVTQ